MPIAPLVLTAFFGVASGDAAQLQSQTLQVDAIAASVEADRSMQRGGDRAQEPNKPTSGDRPHQFGLGGTLGVSNRGAGGGFRYWFGERVGLDLNASWYRPRTASRRTSTGATTTGSSSTFAVVPSVIVMLTKPHPDRDIDLRPYVGAGLNYSNGLSRVSGTQTSPLADRTGGMGMQAFGGVEMTFKGTDALAISAEMAYYKLPNRLVNTPMLDGINYYLMFHYYLR